MVGLCIDFLPTNARSGILRGMNLNEYLSSSRGGTTRLAESVGVAQPTVSRWSCGAKRPSVENCKRIEFATGGAVRCEELRPDLNWDHIRSRKAA